MDRLNQIRGEAGSSQDSTLDGASTLSEAFMSANESTSKYFSLSEVDSTFDISPSKDSITTDAERTITTDTNLIPELSPIPKSELDSYKIGKQIEAANILSGGVNIFDDNDNSYDGDELVIDDNVVEEEKSPVELKLDDNAVLPDEKAEEVLESLDDEVIPSKDTEVVLQIDGNNVHAIDIGNGLYLYRKAGEEELAAVQMIDDDQQQPSFKFLKVRENAEGNLEVYEEIEVEVTKEVPIKEGEIPADKCHVPIKETSKVINEPLCNKDIDNVNKTPKKDLILTSDIAFDTNTDASDPKTDVNFNGKMKFNESRKSPVIGTYTPMTYHSTPNKEGIPLTKTMVDQQLHPSRHIDNVKKTIEVHTDSPKQKLFDTQTRTKKSNAEMLSSKDEDSKESDPSVKTDDRTDIPMPKDGQLESIFSEKIHGNNLQVPNNIDDKVLNDGNAEHDSMEVDSKDTENNIVKLNEDSAVTEVIPDAELPSLNRIEVIQSEIQENTLQLSPNTENNEKDIRSDQDIYNINEEKLQEQTDEVSNDSEAKSIGNDSECNLIIDDKEAILTASNNTDNEEVAEINSNITKEDIDKKDPFGTTISEVNETQNATDKLVAENTCKEKQKNTKSELNQSTVDNNDAINKSNVCNKDNKTCDTIIDINEDCDELVINVNDKSDEPRVENSDQVACDELNSTSESDSKNNLNFNKMPEICKNDIQVKEIENILNENKSTDDVVQKIGKTNSEDIEVCKNVDKDENTISKDIVSGENTKETSHLFKQNTVLEPKPVLLEDRSKNSVHNKTNNIVHEKESNDNNKYCHGDSTYKTNSIELTAKEVNKQDNSIKPTVDPKSKINTNKVEMKTKPIIPKAINNNSAVPFGKWTEANRQEFLNKIKETKIPTNNSNTKQLKQPNDLNRRDVLKKIDSQRQSNIVLLNKASDSNLLPKLNAKAETSAFASKSVMVQQSSTVDTTVKTPNVQDLSVKHKPAVSVKTKQEEPTNSNLATSKSIRRKEINNQDLIDKTIEGIINRAITGKGAENTNEVIPDLETQNSKQCPVSLDDIEMKMCDLHGVTSTEQMTHDTYASKSPEKSETKEIKAKKTEKVPNLLPFTNKIHQKVAKDNVLEDTSEDEIIEHEPITGDLENNKQCLASFPTKNKPPESKKETIITEKDFDKFARRNSITYENCLTVSFDGKESHNVIQTIVEKEVPVKKLSRNELMLAESKAKSTNKYLNTPIRTNTQTSRIPTLVKAVNDEDAYNKNNQSKVQLAYQTALTAKRNLECPITIIEDKPVKVVFVDANTEFAPSQLNVQGHELSPPKTDSDIYIHSTSESLDSDVLESIKIQDDTKVKSRHQRKQVLTPVEEPEIELIEPGDLGIRVSPKKKRRCEEKFEKHSKNVVPKKSYLLNRNVDDEKSSNRTQDLTNNTTLTQKESEKRSESFIGHTDTISAIDNLVKAAELIETQSENKSSEIILQTTEQPLNTPVKRGRGRPRKYPLVEPGTEKNKASSPQKKPKLIETKVTKIDSSDSDDSSDDIIIKENWTMGKINENIVCPICNKLFRSENVVFKHVKHCPGPSPNRSDSDKRSPVRLRPSQDSDRNSRESRSDYTDNEEEVKPRSRRCRYVSSKLVNDNDVIVIEDTPVKEKPEKEEKKEKDTSHEIKKSSIKIKPQHSKTHNLICEFCGKTFRQLSYLVSHKIQQHKKDASKSLENENPPANKTVFSCDVCKKDFRKLHHLVQHRLIHNTNANNVRITRKSSSEQNDAKPLKYADDAKPTNDPSAGFRCEPCDKSFRKLHHLVEHRETHDGINKKSSATSTSTSQNANEMANVPVSHNCDTCKKVFKKLQDLLEHKELHFETSSEKSDDKSVKSSLSTKDIIHECSLCYMVFPNEHSLNKHTVICLRKKKQSAAKAAKLALEKGTTDVENIVSSDNEEEESPKIQQEIEDVEISKSPFKETVKFDSDNETKETIKTIPGNKIDGSILKRKHTLEPDVTDVIIKSETENKTAVNKPDDTMKKTIEDFAKPPKIKKVDVDECIIIPDTPTPKKKILVKDKVASMVTKKVKTVSYPTLPVAKDPRPAESSDDDDVRYMLNPNYKAEETSEGKLFMKVRAKKRNSLQIERPNSKDLVKRRISLQHPPKIPRLKAKAVEMKPIVETKSEKTVKLTVKETTVSTDSDDSDVKYSFPDSASTEANKDKKSTRQSVAAKRKSLSGNAKRKSLGKHKLATPKTRKRTSEAEHRCDCGQLFSSAALLSRHTTLAHTPPRIRRRRSPPPEAPTAPKAPTAPTAPTDKKPPKTKPKQAKRKSEVTSSNIVARGVGTRKSSVNNSDAKVSSDAAKKCEFSGKSLRSSTIRGVPLLDKMRKVVEKTKK